VFENRVLRTIFGPKRDEVTGGLRKLHLMKSVCNFYFSPNIIRVIISMKIRWTGNVARRGRRQMYTQFSSGILREKAPLLDVSIDGSLILKWILKLRQYSV
jgi:hypothetical protein